MESNNPQDPPPNEIGLTDLSSASPVDPTDAIKAVGEAIKFPPGWIPSPIAPVTVPLVMTVIPFDPKVSVSMMDTTNLLNKVTTDYMTGLLGEDKFKSILNDASIIGRANASTESCYSCLCLPYCCFPCFYFCCLKPADQKPKTIFEKWQDEMKDIKDVDFELWFRPGSIWVALFACNFLFTQKTFGFVLRPSKEALMKAAAEQAAKAGEQALKAISSTDGSFNLFSMLGLSSQPAETTSKDNPQSSEEIKNNENMDSQNKPVEITEETKAEPIGDNSQTAADNGDPGLTVDTTQQEEGVTKKKKSSWFSFQGKAKPDAAGSEYQPVGSQPPTSSDPEANQEPGPEKAPEPLANSNNDQPESKKKSKKLKSSDNKSADKSTVTKTPELICGCVEVYLLFF